MEKKIRKLKLNIKGNFKKFWSDHLLKIKSKQLGVAVQDIKHTSDEAIEYTISGEMHRLWEIIRWSQNRGHFFSMNELLIEFID